MYDIDKRANTNLISKLYDIAPDLHEVHEITSNNFHQYNKKTRN